MTERDAKLELAQQHSDFAKDILAIADELMNLHMEMADAVRAMTARIDVLLNQVREEDYERRAKRHYH